GIRDRLAGQRRDRQAGIEKQPPGRFIDERRHCLIPLSQHEGREPTHAVPDSIIAPCVAPPNAVDIIQSVHGSQLLASALNACSSRRLAASPIAGCKGARSVTGGSAAITRVAGRVTITSVPSRSFERSVNVPPCRSIRPFTMGR